MKFHVIWLKNIILLHIKILQDLIDKSTLVQEMTCPVQCWTNFMMTYGITRGKRINTLRQRQNSRQFPDDSFEMHFFVDIWFSINISLEFVP